MWIHNICRVFANIVRYIYLETNNATFFQLCRYILLFLLNILFIFHPVHQKKLQTLTKLEYVVHLLILKENLIVKDRESFDQYIIIIIIFRLASSSI